MDPKKKKIPHAMDRLLSTQLDWRRGGERRRRAQEERGGVTCIHYAVGTRLASSPLGPPATLTSLHTLHTFPSHGLGICHFFLEHSASRRPWGLLPHFIQVSAPMSPPWRALPWPPYLRKTLSSLSAPSLVFLHDIYYHPIFCFIYLSLH